MKALWRKWRRHVFGLGRLAVFAVCAWLSFFLLASGYEAVFNRDLPFVHTLDAVNLSAVSQRYNLQKAADQTPSLLGNFGKPLTLKLPDRSLRLDVAPAILEDGTHWLARANTVHLLIAKPPRNGNIGLALLYCRSSFRTIDQGTLPATGSNIFVDTDKNWRYIYKVTSAHVEPANQPYIVADDGTTARLVIVCYDSAQQDVIVEATLLSVQGVSQ